MCLRLKIRGIKGNTVRTTTSNANGFFVSEELDADIYLVFATKDGYKKARQQVIPGTGETKEITITMKRKSI